MDPARLRRIVTGTDEQGRSFIESVGAPPTVLGERTEDGAWIAEQWVGDAVPVDLADTRELAAERWRPSAPAGGAACRIVQFAPAGSGGRSASDRHSTPTIDCVVVLSGRMWLVVDEGEIELVPGDCVVQRGTSHVWENRSPDEPCVAVAFLASAEQAE